MLPVATQEDAGCAWEALRVVIPGGGEAAGDFPSQPPVAALHARTNLHRGERSPSSCQCPASAAALLRSIDEASSLEVTS